MAASIVGTFTIIDRASGTMRKIERQAKQTDRAVENLGHRLDKVGGGEQARRVDRLSQSMRNEARATKVAGRDTDRLGASTRRLTGEHGRLRTAVQRGTTVLRTWQRAIKEAKSDHDSLAGKLARTGAGFAGLGAILGSLKLPAIAMGVGILVQAVGVLGGGIVALLPRVADLAGTLAALPAAVGAAAQGLGTLLLGLSGVSKAVQAGVELQKNAALTAMQTGDQQRQIAQQMQAAEHGIVLAQRASRDSQLQLTEARRAARRELIDSRLAALGAALGEKRAAIALRQARISLAQGEASGSSDVQLSDLRLGVQEAQLSVRQQREERRRAVADNRRTQRRGIHGNQGVIQAHRAVSDAAYGQVQAMQALTNAQRAATEAQLQAVGPAGQFQQALKGLSPQARSFVHQLVAMRPAFLSLRQAAGADLFPHLSRSLVNVTKLLPTLRSGLRMTGGVIGTQVESLVGSLTTQGRMGDIGTLMGHQAGLIARAGAATQNLSSALIDLMIAARPFTNWLGDTIVGWTRYAAALSSSGRASGRTAAFLDRTKNTLRLFGRILLNVWVTFKLILEAARPLGDRLWRGAERATQGWVGFMQSAEGANKARRWFDALYSPLHALGQLTKLLAQAWARLTLAKGFTQTAQRLQKAVPAIERFFRQTTALGPAAADLLTQVANLLANLPFSAVLILTEGLTKMLSVVNVLLRRFPALGDAISVALLAVAGVKAAKMLAAMAGKVMLLGKAWTAVRDAAFGAAAAEQIAGRGGGVPPLTKGNPLGKAPAPGGVLPGMTRGDPLGKTVRPSGIKGAFSRLKGALGSGLASIGPQIAALIGVGTLLDSFSKGGLPSASATSMLSSVLPPVFLAQQAGIVGDINPAVGAKDLAVSTAHGLGLAKDVKGFGKGGVLGGILGFDPTDPIKSRQGRGTLQGGGAGGIFGANIARTLQLQMGGMRSVTRRGVTGMIREIDKLPAGARRDARRSMVDMARTMERQGLLPRGAAHKLAQQLAQHFDRIPLRAARAMRRTVRGIADALKAALPKIAPFLSGLIDGFGAVWDSLKGKTGLKGGELANRFLQLGGVKDPSKLPGAQLLGIDKGGPAVVRGHRQIATFQRAHGLTPDGVVGPATRRAARGAGVRVVNAQEARRANRPVENAAKATHKLIAAQWKGMHLSIKTSLTRTNKDAKTAMNLLGGNVAKTNDQIRRGTRDDWDRTRQAMSDKLNAARRETGTLFGQIRDSAVKALVGMGYSRGEANKLAGQGGSPSSSLKGTTGKGSAKTKGARGMRIAGAGLADTVGVAPGHLAAPGELISNRHTERRVDRMLSMFGTSLGREVAGESRPHGAGLTYAHGGRTLQHGAGKAIPIRPESWKRGQPLPTRTAQGSGLGKWDDEVTGGKIKHALGGLIRLAKGGYVNIFGALPGMEPLAQLAHEKFGLSVTAGRTNHSKMTASGNVSDHWYGRALDESNGQAPTPQMDAFNAFLKTKTPGIVKQLIWRGKDQFGGFPISDHFNHVHIALKQGYAESAARTGAILQRAAHGFTFAGGGAGGGGGKAGKVLKALAIPPTKLFGVAGGLSQAAAAAIGSGLTSKINSKIGTGGGGGMAATKGGWSRVGATIDPTQGQAPTFSAHGGMSFAELLEAGANAGMHAQDLTTTLGMKRGQYGMPMGTSVLVRMPGSSKAFRMWKNDVGSGQAGNAHFKVDLHQAIANRLGWHPNQDVEVKRGARGMRVGWGGWHAGGVEARVRKPTLFGAGERGPEDVTIRRAGTGHGRPRTTRAGGHTFHAGAIQIGHIVNNREGDVAAMLQSEFQKFTDALDHSGGDEEDD